MVCLTKVALSLRDRRADERETSNRSKTPTGRPLDRLSCRGATGLLFWNGQECPSSESVGGSLEAIVQRETESLIGERRREDHVQSRLVEAVQSLKKV